MAPRIGERHSQETFIHGETGSRTAWAINAEG
jgi:hypothetical protein